MIQEINPYHFDNSYRNEKATCNDKALSFKDGRICAEYDEENRQLIYPNCEEGKEYIYAFSIDEEKYFLHFMEEETDETSDKDHVRICDDDHGSAGFVCGVSFCLWAKPQKPGAGGKGFIHRKIC